MNPSTVYQCWRATLTLIHPSLRLATFTSLRCTPRLTVLGSDYSCSCTRWEGKKKKLGDWENGLVLFVLLLNPIVIPFLVIIIHPTTVDSSGQIPIFLHSAPRSRPRYPPICCFSPVDLNMGLPKISTTSASPNNHRCLTAKKSQQRRPCIHVQSCSSNRYGVWHVGCDAWAYNRLGRCKQILHASGLKPKLNSDFAVNWEWRSEYCTITYYLYRLYIILPRTRKVDIRILARLSEETYMAKPAPFVAILGMMLSNHHPPPPTFNRLFVFTHS